MISGSSTSSLGRAIVVAFQVIKAIVNMYVTDALHKIKGVV